MGLKNVLVKGVNTTFSVFADAVRNGQYAVITDNGFDIVSEVLHPVRVILDRFTQKDVERTSFYDLIQPTDTRGMIPGEDLPVAMNTSNALIVDERRFSIVAFEADAMGVLFTLLLRDTK